MANGSPLRGALGGRSVGYNDDEEEKGERVPLVGSRVDSGKLFKYIFLIID